MLELGRFCIDSEGRHGVILMLIWKFAMQFIVGNRIDVMLGCASFPGMDIEVHREVLSFLYTHNRAPEALRPKPITPPEGSPDQPRYVALSDIIVPAPEFENATRSIPTLLRGYLKLGARISDVAVLDPVFNTTFIAIYVDAKEMMRTSTLLVTTRQR